MPGTSTGRELAFVVFLPLDFDEVFPLHFRALTSIEPIVMTVVESIVRGVQNLPLREQVEVARYVHQLAGCVNSERAATLQRTLGALDDVDGEAFEQAMDEARRVETHGR